MRGNTIFFTSLNTYQRNFASKGERSNSKVQQRHKKIFIQLVYCIVLLPTTTSTNSECGAYMLAVSKNAHHLLVQVNTFLQYFTSASQIQIPYR